MFSSSWLISAQLTTRCPVGWYQSGHYTTSVDTADGNFDCNQASATSRRCDRVVAHRPPRAACISSTSVYYLWYFNDDEQDDLPVRMMSPSDAHEWMSGWNSVVFLWRWSCMVLVHWDSVRITQRTSHNHRKLHTSELTLLRLLAW